MMGQVLFPAWLGELRESVSTPMGPTTTGSTNKVGCPMGLIASPAWPPEFREQLAHGAKCHPNLIPKLGELAKPHGVDCL